MELGYPLFTGFLIFSPFIDRKIHHEKCGFDLLEWKYHTAEINKHRWAFPPFFPTTLGPTCSSGNGEPQWSQGLGLWGLSRSHQCGLSLGEFSLVWTLLGWCLLRINLIYPIPSQAQLEAEYNELPEEARAHKLMCKIAMYQINLENMFCINSRQEVVHQFRSMTLMPMMRFSRPCMVDPQGNKMLFVIEVNETHWVRTTTTGFVSNLNWKDMSQPCPGLWGLQGHAWLNCHNIQRFKYVYRIAAGGVKWPSRRCWSWGPVYFSKSAGLWTLKSKTIQDFWDGVDEAIASFDALKAHTHTCSSITNHHVPKHDCDYHFCMASLPSWLVLKRYENNSGFWTILHVRKPMDGLPVVMSTRPFYVITVHAFVDANFDKAQVHMPKNKSICPGHRWRQPHWWGRPGMFCGG